MNELILLDFFAFENSFNFYNTGIDRIFTKTIQTLRQNRVHSFELRCVCVRLHWFTTTVCTPMRHNNAERMMWYELSVAH